jgi:molecular chaperone GrpE (heat shock protein)
VTDDSPAGGDTEADSPEEWVDSIATAEGIPPEKVIQRLVSSYWTLTEIHDVLDGIDEDIGVNAIDTDAESNAVDAEGETVPTDADAPTADDVEELRERIDRLGEKRDEDRETRADIEADLAQLTQRVDAVSQQLRDRQSTLESRFDEELENLETILEYLVDTTDDLESAIDGLERTTGDLVYTPDGLEGGLESVTEELEIVRSRRAERERLTDLRRTASQLGVRSAACEHCGTSVDIGVLPSADCPDCDRQFVDVERGRGWFGFGTDTLVTAGEERDAVPGDR